MAVPLTSASASGVLGIASQSVSSSLTCTPILRHVPITQWHKASNDMLAAKSSLILIFAISYTISGEMYAVGLSTDALAGPLVIPNTFLIKYGVDGDRIVKVKDRSDMAESRTAKGVSRIHPSEMEVSLNCLQNSAMLTPNGPKAWPMAGPGLAVPAATRNLTIRTRDMSNYI